jgi:hypothetical protein
MTAQELSDYEQSQVDRFGIFAEEERAMDELTRVTEELGLYEDGPTPAEGEQPKERPPR